MRIEVSHPTAGKLPLVGSPLKIPTAPPQIRYPPPLLGQHTNDILQEILGYGEEAIIAMRESGII